MLHAEGHEGFEVHGDDHHAALDHPDEGGQTSQGPCLADKLYVCRRMYDVKYAGVY
jgi:hypothetical protein